MLLFNVRQARCLNTWFIACLQDETSCVRLCEKINQYFLNCHSLSFAADKAYMDVLKENHKFSVFTCYLVSLFRFLM